MCTLFFKMKWCFLISFLLSLGVSDVLVRSFTTVSQGEVISLTVKGALNAELDSKVTTCLYMYIFAKLYNYANFYFEHL